MNNYNEECDRTKFKRPVKWLMGRELLAGLKWIAAYTFMGDKLDPKDWMYAEKIVPPNKNQDNDAYWFDYIADTGDGMNAVYNVAYLCMSELWIDSQNLIGKESVALSTDDQYSELLPRGEFLFVGGDTAYHVADAASLKERFQTPFNCACLDIMRTGKTVDQRPIYGIPANHDYYDALDGFNRQFCQPIATDTHNPMLNDPKDPQLGLLGFKRTQTASYVALDLPFGWWLWGLDSQAGKIDKRQQAFFVSLFQPEIVDEGDLFSKDSEEVIQQALQQQLPAKLIVATPEPSTVFSKWAAPEDEIVNTFNKLGLEPSFLEKHNGKLNPEKCRLDISGDIHHYERYWGKTHHDSTTTNYASVVAGGGGAFLHPSHTDADQVKKQMLYPERHDSHVLSTRAILNPWNIFQGGFIWLAGAFIAFMSYFAITIPESTWSLFEIIPENLRPQIANPGLLTEIRTALDYTIVTQTKNCCSSSYFIDLIYILLFNALLGYWLWKTPTHFNKTGKDNITPIKYSEPEQWNRSIYSFLLPIILGFLPLLIFIQGVRIELAHPFLSGGLIDSFFITSVLFFCLSRRYSDILIDRARLFRETPITALPLWVLNILGVVYAVFGFLHYGHYSSSVMTFDLLILIIWSLVTIGLVALAFFEGGKLYPINKKFRFLAIGLWHAILQVAIPVSLILYCSELTILVITVISIAVTLIAGQIFTHHVLVKDFSLNQQKKIGNLLFASWVIFGVCILLASSWGEPISVSGGRLFLAFIVGAVFSCIWFGWYIAVSLAYHGHNNEAGGGSRSECYRHMIRFKLTENTLTGYVIGIDKPLTDLSDQAKPKFRVVDVFTIHSSAENS